ncbi:MAG: poly[(R)-3-hydroxyalkanoate] polymerase subunit PhaC [Actinomycetota bacterium]|jgi:polyhydroxyalkanoate synthase|nr:poly[(R)-3-hydroxyalkanoate] polymerase subunit PhaC [Actinomycetota bacterium]
MSVRANQPVGVKPRTRASGAARVTTAAEPGVAGDRAIGGQAEPRRAAVGEHDVGLDQLLAAAASGQRRLIPGSEAIKLAAALARRPRTVVRHGASLAADLGRVALGVSEAAPVRGDRRFHDPAWRNWLFRRVLQTYLTLAATSRELVDEAGLDWASDQRLRILVENLIDALAPTNFPLTNPAVLKTTIEKGGANFVVGARAALRDAASPLRLPASVDKTGFVVGETLANSPGAVVRRDPMFELLQYEPRAPEVYQTPVLLIPPMISKYYVVDLSPANSMVRYLGERGLQCFALSWRNVSKAQGHWGLEDYIAGIVEAVGTVAEIAGAEQVHLSGLCAGGIMSTCAAAHLAQIGQIDRLASLNLNVTVLDLERGSPVMAFISPEAAKVAGTKVRQRGYLRGAELSRTFAWLRANDMIWNNFVNNYYLGNSPPALDLLYWNLDSMNMSAGAHADMMRIGLENPLPKKTLELLGTAIDLSKITCDAYSVGGETDHLTPWPACYRSARLLGGRTRFALSTSGHVAAVIHPPGNPKSGYWIGDESIPEPDAWLAKATAHKGTWWEDWSAWLSERSGAKKEPPVALGNASYRPLGPAPGEYVFQRS